MSQEPPQRPEAAEITRRNVRTVRELEQMAVADPSFADRTASFVARFCGSIHFVWVHAVVFGAWIAVNVIPGLPHWDPYPFTFLTMWASMESIFIASFILIAQNYAMRQSERRDQLELQVNLLAEQETTKTLQLLESVARHLGVQQGEDPEVSALAQATRLDALAKEIDETHEEEEREKERGTAR
ncbi:DUF1003 domain-containing protein [Ramlibacter ginsenosidimutans]|uniref:DUF1003 domain-containing protein n=1 Tax=Ramlibacter ginsenosidimutans TaxID=502333 RepID=A0A934WN82_9BURK|nr:DUF1003 domain-containing protein [Ramlibacter ginsenosidimutans]MBK6007401.1 DUF1003 domain-containing protein [Ramlibacter ginsenosidimutans]